MVIGAARTGDEIVALAVLFALVANLYFLYRVVPWKTHGSWRRIWILATLGTIMFIVAEAVTLFEVEMEALDHLHQVPLFGALLAMAAGFYLVYADGYRAAERSRALSLTDAVTGLSNRRALEERLKQAFDRREVFTLLYLDLDGFKQVNDRYGHAAGDDTLRAVAGVLSGCIRGGDMAARLGGDEFSLFLAGDDPHAAALVLERVRERISAAPLPGDSRIGASFGIATNRDGRDAPAVLAVADANMYRAKRAKKEPVPVPS